MLRFLLANLLLCAAVPALALAQPQQAQAEDRSQALAQPQQAQGEDRAQALALEAHQVLADHCAQAAGGQTTKAAESVVVVSDVWYRVSTELEANNERYLLYWRGVLEQCLDQEEKALDDLTAFVEAPADSNLLMELVRDARKRIRRLQTNQSTANRVRTSPQTVVGLGLGFGLAAGAATAGSLSGWHWGQAVERRNQLTAQVNTGQQIQEIRNDMEAKEQTSRGLVVLAVGLGVASTVSFVVTAANRNKVKRRTALQIPVLGPLPSGAVVVWMTPW